VQRVVATRGQRAVDRHQVLHAADLAGQMIWSGIQPELGALSAESSADCTSASYITCRVPGLGARRRSRPSAGQQLLVEAAPVDADAHRLVQPRRNLDHLRELAVPLVALADVAGVDAVLGQRLGAGRESRSAAVPVVVEVADQRHVDAHAVELLADVRHGRRPPPAC
jgi:hypothetical protein